MVSFFHQQGTQIAVHAHGELAIDQVIEAYDKVRGLSAIEGTVITTTELLNTRV